MHSALRSLSTESWHGASFIDVGFITDSVALNGRDDKCIMT
jgi:hypothetical protein